MKHGYTRAQLNILDSYNHGATIRSIAAELSISENAATKWLKELGMWKPRTAKAGTKQVRKPKNCYCSNCEILLSADPGQDGLCGECYTARNKLETDSRYADALLIAIEEVGA